MWCVQQHYAFSRELLWEVRAQNESSPFTLEMNDLGAIVQPIISARRQEGWEQSVLKNTELLPPSSTGSGGWGAAETSQMSCGVWSGCVI